MSGADRPELALADGYASTSCPRKAHILYPGDEHAVHARTQSKTHSQTHAVRFAPYSKTDAVRS